MDPLLLRLGWRVVLHENITTCHENDECKIFLVKEVCMTIVEISLRPPSFGLKMPLQGIVYQVELFMDLVLDYGDLHELLGIVGDIMTNRVSIGTVLGSQICPVVEEAAKKFLKS